MDIKSKRSFQGQGIGGKNKIRLNTDGRNCFGPYDCKYKRVSQVFGGFKSADMLEITQVLKLPRNYCPLAESLSVWG